MCVFVCACGRCGGGAHLNSPSVQVHRELMFQSWEAKSPLKGSIDNPYRCARKKINSVIPSHFNSRTKIAARSKQGNVLAVHV